MTSCSVKLLGNTYEIKCPDGEEDSLQRAVERLNEQIQMQKKKNKSHDQLQTLLLAALHLSHELIICQRQQEYQRQQVSQFIHALENKPQIQPLCHNPDIDPQTD